MAVLLQQLDPESPIYRLIQYFGTYENTARKLGVKSKQVVGMWVKQGYIPSCHGTRVMRATNGTIVNWEVWLAAERIKDKDSEKVEVEI